MQQPQRGRFMCGRIRSGNAAESMRPAAAWKKRIAALPKGPPHAVCRAVPGLRMFLNLERAVF